MSIIFQYVGLLEEGLLDAAYTIYEAKMATAKIGRRGQMTLPRSVRTELELEDGDRVAFVRRGKDIVLQPIRTTLRDLRGFVKVDGPQDFESIRREVQRTRALNRGGHGK